MKFTCLFHLAALVIISFIDYSLLQKTDLAGKWWIAPLLALSFIIVLANLQGIIMTIRQKLAAARPQKEWKDGKLVGISGKIQALHGALQAPISGRGAAIVEYDIKRTEDRGESTVTVSAVNGMLMTPCAIHTPRGQVRIVGFPLLASITGDFFDEEADYERAAQYIATTEFKEKPSNPMKLLAELNALLADDDGDLKADFKEKSFYIPNSFDEDDLEEEEDSEKSILNATKTQGEFDKVAAVVSNLKSGRYSLEETAILQGAEVTVFGTYRAAKQAIDVGSGLKNLNHTMQLGNLKSALGRNFKRNLIAFIFWGAVCATAHYYVGKYIGIF